MLIDKTVKFCPPITNKGKFVPLASSLQDSKMIKENKEFALVKTFQLKYQGHMFISLAMLVFGRPPACSL